MDEYDYRDFLISFRDAFAAWTLMFTFATALIGSSLLRDHEQVPADDAYTADL